MCHVVDDDELLHRIMWQRAINASLCQAFAKLSSGAAVIIRRRMLDRTDQMLSCR